MATWEQISQEMVSLIQQKEPGPDIIRRIKLNELYKITKRPIMLYAVEMFNRQKINLVQGDIAIDLSDRDGFIEALRDIPGTDIDIIIHSPGGSPEATESLVKMIRKRFTSVRFIIPNVAKSAATMLAMSGDEIILGNDAEIGPTDPQLVVNGRFSPAHAILTQFDNAKRELKADNTVISAWLPILQQYGPSLLSECKDAIKLTKRLVTDWLALYMFKGVKKSKIKTAKVSNFLANKKHLSHSRGIDIDELKKKGVKIKYASECTPDLSESIQNISYSISLTFMMTGAVKIFENYLGKGVYKVVEQKIIQIPQPSPFPTPQNKNS